MSRHATIVKNLTRLIAEKDTNPSAIARAAGLGHTAARDIQTGKTQNPTDRVLRQLADALGVTPADITGDAPSITTAGLTGFSESDAAPYFAPQQQGRAASQSAPSIASLLAPHAKSPVEYAVARALPGFGLMHGDILIIDLGRSAEMGEIVVATIADQTTGEAHTVVRRNITPYLISGDPAAAEHFILADGNRAAIMAPVVAMYRPPTGDLKAKG